jgi:hypothetical protein
MGVSGQRHVPAALKSRVKDPRTHCTGVWVDPRADLDTEAIGKILSPLPRIEPRPPGRRARSHHYTDWATRLTRVLNQGGKARPERDADHSPHVVPRSRMSIPPLSLSSYMACNGWIPDRLWGPPSILSNGYRASFLWGQKRGRGVTLITHPHLAQRLWMSGSYTSSPPKRLHGV